MLEDRVDESLQPGQYLGLRLEKPGAPCPAKNSCRACVRLEVSSKMDCNWPAREATSVAKSATAPGL